jgi:hypothetical protein
LEFSNSIRSLRCNIIWFNLNDKELFNFNKGLNLNLTSKQSNQDFGILSI